MIINMGRGWKNMKYNSGPGAVYGLGLIGALVYYLQKASTFTEGLIGVLKAFVWPALFVHKILSIWGM